MNRTSALVLTAFVSAVAGAGSMWYVMRPSSPVIVESDSLLSLRPQISHVGFKFADQEEYAMPLPPRKEAARKMVVSGSNSSPADNRTSQTGVPPAAEGTEPEGGLAVSGRVVRTVSIASGGLPTAGSSPVQEVDVENLTQDAVILEQVLVPIPSETFAMLDEVSKKTWLRILRPLPKVGSPSGVPEEAALRLGAIIAEGFIAVEAEDIADVDLVGRNAEYLSKALGAESLIKKRRLSIASSAKQRDWAQIRRNLDGIVPDIREANSEHLANLVSLGSWLRTTEALTTLIADGYSEDAAELLHQPATLDHLQRSLTKLPQWMRTELTVDIQRTLAELRKVMGSGAPIPSVSEIIKIRKITGVLVQRIVSNPRAARSISAR